MDARDDNGRAVQVDPIKPTLKAPGTKRLKLKYDELLSSFAFKFNLRRYTLAETQSMFLDSLCGDAAWLVGSDTRPQPEEFLSLRY